MAAVPATTSTQSASCALEHFFSEAAWPLGTRLAINRCGNGYQNHCEKLETADSKKTKLVFHRYGDQYFLAQIWTEGNNRGSELPKTEREPEVAMGYPAAQDVVVVATLR